MAFLLLFIIWILMIMNIFNSKNCFIDAHPNGSEQKGQNGENDKEQMQKLLSMTKNINIKGNSYEGGNKSEEEEKWEVLSRNSSVSEDANDNSYEIIEKEFLKQKEAKRLEEDIASMKILLKLLEALDAWNCEQFEDDLRGTNRRRCAIWEQWCQLLKSWLRYKIEKSRPKTSAENSERELSQFALQPLFKYGGREQPLELVVSRIGEAYRTRGDMRYAKLPTYDVPNLENCEKVAKWANTFNESSKCPWPNPFSPKTSCGRKAEAKKELEAVKAHIEGDSGDVFCEQFEVPDCCYSSTSEERKKFRKKIMDRIRNLKSH